MSTIVHAREGGGHENVHVDRIILGPFYVSGKVGGPRGHSITTWTRRGGEGVNQMSTIVHVREGGGHENVHVDRIFGKT